MPVSLPSPGLFMPLLLSGACTGNLDGRESEPNENRDEATPICIGVPVKGFPNDSGPPGAELDYYEFYWNGQGTLQVDLTGFVADGQLILYHVDTEVAKDYDDDPTVIDYQIIYNGAAGPGLYRVLATAGVERPTPGSDYTLLVTVY